MFTIQSPRTGLGGIGAMLRVTYHYTARKIQGKHPTAAAAIASSVFQIVVMLGFFYMITFFMGGRQPIRGNYALFLLTGIFLFMCFNKGLSAVFGSEGHGSAAMIHPAMNALVAIISSAVSALYLQAVSIAIVALVYWAVVGTVEIEDPVGLLGCMVLAWAVGCAIGMVFRAMKFWFPGAASMIVRVFSRANMFFSGKLFVANTMPFWFHHLFSWNPLFHIIDQARGYAFINYTPQTTALVLPFWVFFGSLAIGLMGDFYALTYRSRGWWTKG